MSRKMSPERGEPCTYLEKAVPDGREQAMSEEMEALWIIRTLVWSNGRERVTMEIGDRRWYDHADSCRPYSDLNFILNNQETLQVT